MRKSSTGLMDENTRVLDVGCGHVDFMKPIYERSEHIYGLDPNLRDSGAQ